jgi:putative NADH-flavin reductase
MKLAVFGSNGQTGIQIVLQTLGREHQMTAIARNPSTIGISHENLAVNPGALLDFTSAYEMVLKKRQGDEK